MLNYLPKILAFLLAVILCLILANESQNSFRFLEKDDYDIPERIPVRRHMTKKKKTYFNLYSGMDEIKRQNSDTIPPRAKNITAGKLCEGTHLCLSSAFRHETRYRIAPDYKMINCVVHKSMSTVITGIMCYLYNRKHIVKVDKQMNMTEWDKALLCHNRNTFSNLKQKLIDINATDLNGWSLSMITRDPVERFLSGYVDRCIRISEGPKTCNGCDKNMTCFILKEYARFKKQTRRGKLVNTIEDRHFYPQNWRCDLKTMKEKYEFIRYSSDPSQQLMTDLFKIARRQKVPENELEYIKSELTKNRKTTHTTANSPARDFYEKRLRENPLLMEYVIKMFYYDFVILGYPFPTGF
ncbi:unnamed protein product [Caenorhabditis bovis]|uniref:Sulfotransferase domain-containing protein n=1 Tax=Caenorhabditis bovis TaxID=2654633 RepID=A0A8S1EI61_9PELO|nr:unnamed protein product [Caenorhabditis bovis]